MFQLGRRGAENAHPDVDTDADQGNRPGAGPCSVLISDIGTVTVDGEVIATASSSDAAQTVILDHLHQRALHRAAPVEASILDQQQAIVLRIRVREDGASELLEDPKLLKAPKAPEVTPPPGPAPAPAPVTPPPGPAPAPAPVPSPPSSPPTAAPTTPPQSRPSPVDHTPSSTVSSSAEPVGVPEALVTAVALVCETVNSGDLAEAKAHAAALERHAVHVFGPDHHYTLEARALEAHVAHLMGDHATATRLSLQVAAARHRQGDIRAQEDIERAVVSWQLLTVPFTAVPLGRHLLSLWSQISEAAGTERYAEAERRLSMLARITPPPFGASMTRVS
ncbi:hypothetical protein ACFWD7_58070 [Streptomyces mirabilis]|uniref:hypothetical protein n=1 Tax=Streptomyces mirabilis TaxID=68239 RepID=UPI00367524F4